MWMKWPDRPRNDSDINGYMSEMAAHNSRTWGHPEGYIEALQIFTETLL